MTKAEQILAALGGAGNIVEIEPCITRLRTEVKDPSVVDQAALKAAGAHGVMASGTAQGGTPGLNGLGMIEPRLLITDVESLLMEDATS